MIRTTLVCSALISLGLGASGLAHAADCVAIDTQADTLSADEQRAARILLTQVLEDRGRVVAGGGCELTWSLSHVKLGNPVTVRLAGKGDPVKLTAGSMDELPAVYERLVDAALTGKAPEDTARRDTVTDAEANPNRTATDSMMTLMVGGGGGLSGGPPVGGLALSTGYRAELDKIAIDGSVRLLVPTSAAIESGRSGVYFSGRIAVLAFLAPEANMSPYLGGGLGFGAGATGGGSGYGLNIEGVAGLSMLRTSKVRLFTELDISAPTWTANDTWMPWGALMFGIGYEPQQRSGLLR